MGMLSETREKVLKIRGYPDIPGQLTNGMHLNMFQNYFFI